MSESLSRGYVTWYWIVLIELFSVDLATRRVSGKPVLHVSLLFQLSVQDQDLTHRDLHDSAVLVPIFLH